jgi:hypothetical protein
VRRIVRFAVLVFAILYFMVDAVFLKIATPLAKWMARQRALVGVRKWIVALGPYPSLVLFAVPLIVLEPVKPVAVYLIGTGRIATGTAVVAVGELIKLVLVERLFKLCRRKLLRIPVFAWGYGHWRQGVDWIVGMPAWQAARRWILKYRRLSRNLLVRVKRSSRYRRSSRHLAEAHRSKTSPRVLRS